jgi:hypothetical protein
MRSRSLSPELTAILNVVVELDAREGPLGELNRNLPNKC